MAVVTLPDCMMPDGADPCRGYRELRERAETWQLACRNAERARDEAIAQRDKAEAELAELRRDAERYRWLRGEADVTGERWARWNLQRWDGRCWHSLELTALDAAIDAARKP